MKWFDGYRRKNHKQGIFNHWYKSAEPFDFVIVLDFSI